MIMLTLWTLVHTLTSSLHTPDYPMESKIETMLEIELSKIKSNSHYDSFANTNSIQLSDGVRFEKLILRRSIDNRSSFVSIEEIQGCIDIKEIEVHLGDLSPLTAPNPSSTKENAIAFNWKVVNGVKVHFGFKSQNFKCLDSISMDI